LLQEASGFTLVVARWATALIVVDEIMARARLASTFRAVHNVDTNALVVFDVGLETTVTVAFVVLEMIACRFSFVHTLAVRTTGVSFAVIHVHAASMPCDGPVGLASLGVLGCTIEASIQ
jgi:hypothetical protein